MEPLERTVSRISKSKVTSVVVVVNRTRLRAVQAAKPNELARWADQVKRYDAD